MKKRIEIKLTSKERDLIVNKTFAGSDLIEPLERAQIEDDLVTVYYSPQDLEGLLGFIAAEANHANDEVLEAELDSLSDRLEDILADYEEEL
jgi:phage major head subunit gpT-like protein